MSEEGQSSLTEERVKELIKNSSVSSEAKSSLAGLRLDKNGLQHQYDTLVKIDESLAKVESTLQTDAEVLDASTVLDPVREARSVIRDRVKLLRIADVAGWAAVAQYQGAANLGDDVEDSKRIQKSIDASKSKAKQFTRPAPYQADRPIASPAVGRLGGIRVRDQAPMGNVASGVRIRPAGPQCHVSTVIGLDTGPLTAPSKAKRIRLLRPAEASDGPEIPEEKVVKCKILAKKLSGASVVTARKLAQFTGLEAVFKERFMGMESCMPDFTGSIKQLQNFIFGSKSPNTGSFSLHSLRAGGATAAAGRGVVDRVIQQHGRWKSEKSKNHYVTTSVREELKASIFE